MKTKKVRSPDTRIEAEVEATRAMLDISKRTITDRATTLFVDRICKEAVRIMVAVEDQTMRGIKYMLGITAARAPHTPHIASNSRTHRGSSLIWEYNFAQWVAKIF